VPKYFPNPAGHGQFKKLEPHSFSTTWRSKSKKKNRNNLTKPEIDAKKKIWAEKKAAMNRPALSEMELKPSVEL
jgi:hypothetical protein